MEKIFLNKTVLVTGGSFGIGRAAAVQFAQLGATVIIADWLENKETIETITSNGGKAVFFKCDVSIDAEVRLLIKGIAETYGRLDMAFNNAGVEGLAAITGDCTDENWDKVMNINLKGVWLCMKYELQQMLQQKSGAIVNNASIAGLVGFPGIPAYVASKHGILGLTKNAALEYAKAGIRVNAVCPGVIKTAMIDRFTGKKKEAEQQFENSEPVGRMGTPEEVAEAVVWLSSGAASFVTGQALAVDGGWVAQ